jgi:WD40 repeat protein
LDKTARLWDLTTSKLIGEFPQQALVWTVAFGPDGKTILLHVEGTTRLWDTTTRQPIGLPIQHPSGVFAAAFSPDGKTILTGSLNGTLQFWDTATSQPIGSPMRHQTTVSAVAFSPDGKTALSASVDGEVRVWPIAKISDDLERVATWVEALTGLTLEAGSVQSLDRVAWLERREKVERQGGPPVNDAKCEPVPNFFTRDR